MAAYAKVVSSISANEMKSSLILDPLKLNIVFDLMLVYHFIIPNADGDCGFIRDVFKVRFSAVEFINIDPQLHVHGHYS